MKEAVVYSGPRVEIIDSSVPEPGPDQVVTRVIVSGSNPKDWKVPEKGKEGINQGDDIAGIVQAVGDNVTEFRPGDRVAAFHEMLAPGGSYAEYAVSWQHSTFHLPKKTSFEEAATIPLAGITAAVGLYLRLGLPPPWQPTLTPIPLIIYGASSAVGSFAVQLASASNIHPIIAIAGRGTAHVEKLIDRSKGDVVVDYRAGPDAIVQGVKEALHKNGLQKVSHALDAISEKGSYQTICRVLDPHDGNITLVLPWKNEDEFPPGIAHSVTLCAHVHADVDPNSPAGKAGIRTGGREFGLVFFRLFARGLQQGWFKGHPYEVVPGGLNGVESALTNLKEGKASAVKYVFRIGQTPGVGKEHEVTS